MTNVMMTMTNAEAQVAQRIASCLVQPSPDPMQDICTVSICFASLKALEEFIHSVRVSASVHETLKNLQARKDALAVLGMEDTFGKGDSNAHAIPPQTKGWVNDVYEKE